MEDKAFIEAKVKEIIMAPSCCAELKAVGEAYLAALHTPAEKEAGIRLLKELQEDVQDIDSVLALFTSEEGKKLFGAETASQLAETAKKVKAEGGKTCFCPACAAGQAILDNREAVY